LYSDVVNDSLAEFSYDADLADLSYKLHQHSNGLYVTMKGYNDKMAILATHIMARMKTCVVDPQQLAIVKEKVCDAFFGKDFSKCDTMQARMDWQNFFLGQSYSLSGYFCSYALTDQLWSLEENLKELPCKLYYTHPQGASSLNMDIAITPEEIQTHMRELLSQVNLRILVTGNIYKDVSE